MNAVDFIKQSVFYTSKKYARIRPIVDKVVTDSLTERDLKELVDAVAPSGTSTHIDVATETSSPATRPVPPTGADERRPVKIKAVKKISDTKNIALIKQTPPIELAEGLNIFYGHNGDGKTTLYRAISNCLGLAEHSLDNVALGAAQPPEAHLTVEDMQGNEFDLTWPSGTSTRLDLIRQFDARVCLALVENDQDNTFSLAHLLIAA